MPGWKDLEQNQEIILHICSFLDTQSLANLSMVSKGTNAILRQCFHLRDWSEMRDIYRQSLAEYQDIVGTAPQRTEQSGIIANTLQLQSFHTVLQMLLETINEADERELNIVTGEDLLYSVGRLSMMIADADYLPPDHRSLPLNWTSEKYLRERLKLQQKSISLITRNLKHHSKALASPSGSLLRYQHSVSCRIFDKISNKVYKEATRIGNREHLLDTDTSDLGGLSWALTQKIISYLNVEELQNLALVNKRFLILIGMTPPSCLLKDRFRSSAVMQCALSAARMIKKDKQLLTGVAGLTKKERNIIQNSIGQQLLKDFEKEMKANEISKAMKKKSFRNMELRWGHDHALALADTGAVRLIFSQALDIMNRIGDTKSTALDLSYERIVQYLNLLPQEQVHHQLQRALSNPQAVDNAFFGELAILLVGIEGSQNNFTVLHTPMIMDLVCAGTISWEQALFQRSDIPYFVMAGDKSEKGPGPMVRHSEMIRKGQLSKAEIHKGSVDKFQKFFDREIDLHSLFFQTFFPDLAQFDAPSQLILSSIIVKNYLCQRFGVKSSTSETLGVKLRSLIELHKKNFAGLSDAPLQTAKSTSSTKKYQNPFSSSGRSRWYMIPLHERMRIGLDRLEALQTGTEVEVLNSNREIIAYGRIDWEYGNSMSVQFTEILDPQDWLFSSNNWWKSGIRFDKGDPTIQPR